MKLQIYAPLIIFAMSVSYVHAMQPTSDQGDAEVRHALAEIQKSGVYNFKWLPHNSTVEESALSRLKNTILCADGYDLDWFSKYPGLQSKYNVVTWWIQLVDKQEIFAKKEIRELVKAIVDYHIALLMASNDNVVKSADEDLLEFCKTLKIHTHVDSEYYQQSDSDLISLARYYFGHSGHGTHVFADKLRNIFHFEHGDEETKNIIAHIQFDLVNLIQFAIAYDKNDLCIEEVENFIALVAWINIQLNLIDSIKHTAMTKKFVALTSEYLSILWRDITMRYMPK
jgi:hypothetical protein